MARAHTGESVLNVIPAGGGETIENGANSRETTPGLQTAGAAPAVRHGRSRWRLAKIHNRLLDFYGIALLVVLWEIAPRLGWVDSQFFPPPSLLIIEARKMLAEGTLFIHIGSSLQRTLQGLLCAILTATPLGFILGGWFPRLARFLSPLLGLLGQINAFSLFPLFVLFFGIGELAKFSIIYWSCLWPILFTTIAGVQGVEPLFIKQARSMGSGRLILFFRVLLPAALPSIFTGVRIGATVAFLMLIAAEMMGANNGLGWLIHNSNINYIIPRLYLATILIALLGMALDYAISLLERRVIRWKDVLRAA